MPAVTLLPKHQHQLKRFVRLVDEMRRCRFINAYCTTDQTIGAGEDENGEEWHKNPTYHDENFRSFLTLYRQVGWAKNDPESVNLEKILNLVDLYAEPALKAKAAEIRRVTLPLMKGQYSAFKFTKFKDDFEPEKTVTSFETLDALMNGYVFHPDKAHAATVEFLDEAESWMYLWPVMHEIIEPMLRGCVYLFCALREYGILTDADYPTRCFDKSDPLLRSGS